MREQQDRGEPRVPRIVRSATGSPRRRSRSRCRAGSSRSSRTPACSTSLTDARARAERGRGVERRRARRRRVGGGAAARACSPSGSSTLRAREFWDPRPGAGLLAGRRFDRMLRDDAAGHRDARVPRAGADQRVRHRAPRAPRCSATHDLADAIRASCAVPGPVPPGVDRSPRVLGRRHPRPSRPRRRAGGRARAVPSHQLALAVAASLDVPRRPGMVTLVVDGLPRSGRSGSTPVGARSSSRARRRARARYRRSPTASCASEHRGVSLEIPRVT